MAKKSKSRKSKVYFVVGPLYVTTCWVVMLRSRYKEFLIQQNYRTFFQLSYFMLKGKSTLKMARGEENF